MSGIGYDSSIVVYNKLSGDWNSDAVWFGTLLDHVRVELVTGNTQTVNGDTAANTCTVKIYDADLPGTPATREAWNGMSEEEKESNIVFDRNTFFLIAYKPDIGIRNQNAPTGKITEDSDQYPNGFIQYLTDKYGGVYHVRTVQHYSLIPHWEIGGA